MDEVKVLPKRLVPHSAILLFVPSECVPVVVITKPLLYVNTRCLLTCQVRVVLSANLIVIPELVIECVMLLRLARFINNPPLTFVITCEPLMVMLLLSATLVTTRFV